VPATPAQTAINTGLTSLAGALTQAGLADGINGLSDVTIFAPSNDAFEAIGSAVGTLSSQTLASILAYHVLSNQVRFSADLIAAGSPATFVTAQGSSITLRRENGQLFVNSARVLIPDIPTTNGVVHVIDKLVYIPGPNYVLSANVLQRPEPIQYHCSAQPGGHYASTGFLWSHFGHRLTVHSRDRSYGHIRTG